MAWEGSTRSARLPPNWTHLREQTKQRAGGRCQAIMHDGTRCTEPGTDCDHIQHGDNHNPSNLQWLCAWHHNRKTQAEARAGRKPRVSARIPTEQHPGLR